MNPTPRTRFTVALTGGIASGKSEVARRFAALGAGVVDADVVARELVKSGTPALDEIAATFGSGMLGSDGSLDRAAMRALIFNDSAAKALLESILHPRVREVLRRHAEETDAVYAMLVIPLFVESGAYGWVDRVLVVDATREDQIARLIARDGVSEELARTIVDVQATREQRLAAAHDVIDNSGSPEALDAAVAALHERYVALARTPRGGGISTSS